MSSHVEIIDLVDDDNRPVDPNPDTSPPPATSVPALVDQLPTSIESIVSMAGAIEHIVDRVHSTQCVTSAVRGRREECFAIALRAHEVGIPIMQALGGDLFIIDGKVGMSAESMRALVVRAGHRIEVVETGAETVTLTGHRADSATLATVTWTIDEARAAGLVRPGSSWTKYPSAMLIARATSALCRLVFPDVIRGVSYTAEELQSIAPHRTVVPATVVEHDWPSLGWHDQADHDRQMNEIRAAIRAADDTTRDALLADWNTAGLSWPLTAHEMTQWRATCQAHGVDLKPDVEQDDVPGHDVAEVATSGVDVDEVKPEKPKTGGRGPDRRPGARPDPRRRATPRSDTR